MKPTPKWKTELRAKLSRMDNEQLFGYVLEATMENALDDLGCVRTCQTAIEAEEELRKRLTKIGFLQ